jgi:hypothetical protein
MYLVDVIVSVCVIGMVLASFFVGFHTGRKSIRHYLVDNGKIIPLIDDSGEYETEQAAIVEENYVPPEEEEKEYRKWLQKVRESGDV